MISSQTFAQLDEGSNGLWAYVIRSCEYYLSGGNARPLLISRGLPKYMWTIQAVIVVKPYRKYTLLSTLPNLGGPTYKEFGTLRSIHFSSL
jgi:hypothetical protein